METNDYLGSFAQENVTFQTRVVKTANVGDNYWKVMVFVESARYINDASAFVAVKGSSTIKAATVTADTYAEITKGLLQSWLTDLFVSGFTGDVYLVTPTTGDIGSGGAAAWVTAMETAYDLLKPYAYWKTVLVGASVTSAEMIAAAPALATKCLADKELLSGPVCLPYSTATPATTSSDALYTAVEGKYVFMAQCADATRNAALFSLGLALAAINGSGTPVGNQFDMVGTQNFIPSATGTEALLTRTERGNLNDLGIQTFKYVGDNTEAVAAEGGETLDKVTISAQWVLCYVAYMVKVRVAKLMTTRNFYKNESNYIKILGILAQEINLFGTTGSGRLEQVKLTAPAFSSLPPSDADELIVPDAWEATYVDNVRKVTITGTLYIGA